MRKQHKTKEYASNLVFSVMVILFVAEFMFLTGDVMIHLIRVVNALNNPAVVTMHTEPKCDSKTINVAKITYIDDEGNVIKSFTTLAWANSESVQYTLPEKEPENAAAYIITVGGRVFKAERIS